MLMSEVMSYTSELQIQQLMASLPPDCAAQLDPLVYIETDSGTTVEIASSDVEGDVSARGIVACYGHTHAKTVRNVIGQALYTVNVWLQ